MMMLRTRCSRTLCWTLRAFSSSVQMTDGRQRLDGSGGTKWRTKLRRRRLRMRVLGFLAEWPRFRALAVAGTSGSMTEQQVKARRAVCEDAPYIARSGAGEVMPEKALVEFLVGASLTLTQDLPQDLGFALGIFSTYKKSYNEKEKKCEEIKEHSGQMVVEEIAERTHPEVKTSDTSSIFL